jgi:hypothetical protein
MPHDPLAYSHNQALSGKKLGGVAGLPQDMKTLEMDPQGVSGIGQSSVRESVSKKKVAEFIVTGRLGDGKYGQQACARREGRKPHHHDGQPALLCQAVKQLLRALEPTRAKKGHGAPSHYRQHSQTKLNPEEHT